MKHAGYLHISREVPKILSVISIHMFSINKKILANVQHLEA